jgi:hypothetical protein
MMSNVWMMRLGLVTGAIASLGAGLFWLLLEQDLSARALPASAAWGFLVGLVWVFLWIVVSHGEALEDLRHHLRQSGAGVDRVLVHSGCASSWRAPPAGPAVRPAHAAGRRPRGRPADDRCIPRTA